jgi:hypothetical protein
MVVKKKVTKKAVKKASPKKKASSKKVQTSIDPIRIVVEVVIRNETTLQEKSIAKSLTPFDVSDALELGGDCPDNKFTYSFDTKKGEVDHSAIIHSLKVEAFEKFSPGDSGKFTTCINDISEEPSIRVTVFASENMPGGRASLQLKFNGRDVFSPERELNKMPGGNLGFSELVKLP